MHDILKQNLHHCLKGYLNHADITDYSIDECEEKELHTDRIPTFHFKW